MKNLIDRSHSNLVKRKNSCSNQPMNRIIPKLFFTTLLISSLLFLVSCKKENESEISIPTPTAAGTSTIKFQLAHSVDSFLLEFDTLLYTNEAGNLYRVSRLEYYVSKIVFLSPEGDFSMDSIYYVNAKTNPNKEIIVQDVPRKKYTGIRFYIGLDSVHNISNSLPATSENQAMAWPDPMGGGYHFMKFEGHFQDSTALPGYAIHLGRNANLPTANCSYAFEPQGNELNLKLNMNLNEWFRNPITYNLKTDGSYTMNNMAAMQKIRSNGSDVFTLSTP